MTTAYKTNRIAFPKRAAAMQNNALFDALHDLMADTHTFYTTYSGYQEGSLAYYWAVTDSVAGSDSYVMFYSDLSPSDEGVRLNREHIWPKSRASYATSFGGADLHHLRPSARRFTTTARRPRPASAPRRSRTSRKRQPKSRINAKTP